MVDEEEADPDAAEYLTPSGRYRSTERLHPPAARLPVSERLYAQKPAQAAPSEVPRAEERRGGAGQLHVSPHDYLTRSPQRATFLRLRTRQDGTRIDPRMRASTEKRRAILTPDEDEHVGRG